MEKTSHLKQIQLNDQKIDVRNAELTMTPKLRPASMMEIGEPEHKRQIGWKVEVTDAQINPEFLEEIKSLQQTKISGINEDGSIAFIYDIENIKKVENGISFEIPTLQMSNPKMYEHDSDTTPR